MKPSLRLSKSKFMSGLQCPKMLWWKVHDAQAPELATDTAGQAIFDRGHRVGELARTHVPGGVLIDLPYHALEERVAATREALAAGAPAIYEASFLEDGVFVAVDILEKRRDGFVLVEVKSTLRVKDEHLPDVGIQLHILRRAGLKVKRAEVMHLNRDCRHPDLSNLFVRVNVTAEAEATPHGIPRRIREFLAVIAGPLPKVPTGDHCMTPYPCAFLDRCHPALPKNHVSTLYRIRSAKVQKLVEEGFETIADLPKDFAAEGPVARQVASVRTRKMIVEPGLTDALRRLKAPIGFLDFETIMPAIPAWPGCAPYEQVPVQFSCHVVGLNGTLGTKRTQHHAWLAEGPGDPRPAFARALVDACADARTVLAYNAPFEKERIAGLIAAVPRLAPRLRQLSSRIVDLLPIVRDHVYHPGFHGSFSIKSVLPALVPGLGYDDLEVQDGQTASAMLEAMLLGNDEPSARERKALRRKLLRYCERDSYAMVRLLARLRQVA